jgi:hypothetical protein
MGRTQSGARLERVTDVDPIETDREAGQRHGDGPVRAGSVMGSPPRELVRRHPAGGFESPPGTGWSWSSHGPFRFLRQKEPSQLDA